MCRLLAVTTRVLRADLFWAICCLEANSLSSQVAIDTATPLDDAGPSESLMMNPPEPFGGYGGSMRTYGRMYGSLDFDDVSMGFDCWFCTCICDFYILCLVLFDCICDMIDTFNCPAISWSAILIIKFQLILWIAMTNDRKCSFTLKFIFVWFETEILVAQELYSPEFFFIWIGVEKFAMFDIDCCVLQWGYGMGSGRPSRADWRYRPY